MWINSRWEDTNWKTPWEGSTRYFAFVGGRTNWKMALAKDGHIRWIDVGKEREVKGSTNPKRRILGLHQLKNAIGVFKKWTKVTGKLSWVFPFSKGGTASQPNKRVNSSAGPEIRRKKRARSAYSVVQPSRLTIRMEHGSRKGGPSQGPIHSKKPKNWTWTRSSSEKRTTYNPEV